MGEGNSKGKGGERRKECCNYILTKNFKVLGLVVHAFNFSTQEVEGGVSF